MARLAALVWACARHTSQTSCARAPDVPWFEVHICNYLGGGINRRWLSAVAGCYPLSFHGVNLNLGGTDPLDRDYLRRLKSAVDECQPALVSEHLCFNQHQGRYFHDLLPLPHTGDAVQHVAGRIREVQDTLGRRLLVENITRYFSYPESELSEGEFISAVCEEADCDLLLDLTNAWINQQNLGIAFDEFLQSLPLQRVEEVHMAGVGNCDGQFIDSHSSAPDATIWDCYRQFCGLKSGVPCLIEWDDSLPPLDDLLTLQATGQQIFETGTDSVEHAETLLCN